jgi:chemotaxis protein MotB
VLRFFIDKAGVEEARLSAVAYADTRPVADNETPEGRASNRRADIVIVYPTIAELNERFGTNEE